MSQRATSARTLSGNARVRSIAFAQCGQLFSCQSARTFVQWNDEVGGDRNGRLPAEKVEQSRSRVDWPA